MGHLFYFNFKLFWSFPSNPTQLVNHFSFELIFNTACLSMKFAFTRGQNLFNLFLMPPPLYKH